jgi:chorismate mutase
MIAPVSTDSPNADGALTELARCRDEIERLDDALLDALARRVAVARRVGEMKQLAGLPVLDPRREAEVLRRVSERARERGLPVEPVRELYWRIMALARETQREA